MTAVATDTRTATTADEKLLASNVIRSTLALSNLNEDETETDPLVWQEDALCAQTDPEAFFPEKGGPAGPAKRICGGCPVRGDCLEYALANDERFGIWGGLSEGQRRRLVKARAKA